MSNKKSRSSKDKSDRGTADSKKEGETAKRKEPYGHDEKPQIILGTEREVHEEILRRRMGGGAPPTPEAYARALQQWQRLPGSVVRPPTDVRRPAQEPPKSPEASPPSPRTADDADEEEHQP